MGGRGKWVSVNEALSDFPPLDAKDQDQASDPVIPFHRVPVLDAKKYDWISHTPPGMSAFDNQCANPLCFYDGNLTHGAERNAEGVNRGKKGTPLYCTRCGTMLPRPYAIREDGQKKIMSGFTSAYKRMAADLPAPALTRNLSYPCSDQKVHPTQNRVLSLAEAMRLQTISQYSYSWRLQTSKAGRLEDFAASDTLVRHVIGESVPPLFFEALARHILDITFNSQRQTPTALRDTANQMALSF
jgi:DNA (cytosine-5)-methyltransferase 1